MPSCPFDGSERYKAIILECPGCRGKIKERMYCPADKGMHTFTILGGRLGCWNESCPQRVYSSKRVYDNYDRSRYERQLPPPQPTYTRLCPVCNQPLAFIQQYSRWYCSNCKQYRQ